MMYVLEMIHAKFILLRKDGLFALIWVPILSLDSIQTEEPLCLHCMYTEASYV